MLWKAVRSNGDRTRCPSTECLGLKITIGLGLRLGLRLRLDLGLELGSGIKIMVSFLVRVWVIMVIF